MLLQLRHAFFELQQRKPQPLDFRFAERTGVDAPNGLSLDELTNGLHKD